VKRALFLDVVVGERPSILELLPSKDESLLIRRDSLLVLNLGLHIIDRVRRLDLQRDRLAGQSLHEDLHATTQTQDEMKGGLLLDVVIRKSAAVLKLLPGENQALLIGWDALLILNFRLDVVDRVRRLDLQGDRLSGKRLNEDLHTTTETQDKMKGRLLLDVIIRESTPILELLAGKDKTLLVRWDTLLVLDLRLDVVDRIRRLNLKSDGLPSQSLDEDLHTTTQAEDEMQGRLLLDVIVRKGTAVFELLAREDETLLVGRDALLVLDLGLDIINGIGGLDLEGDGLARESLDKDLHSGRSKSWVW